MDPSESVPAGEGARNTHRAPTKNVVETLIEVGGFTKLVAAMEAAGLNVELAAKGPFTVFAPTDEAFRDLPAGVYEKLLKDRGKLKAVLNYHVVAGYFMVRDLKSGEVATLQGTSLTAVVSSSGVRVNEAHVTRADIAATNGIVHAIDVLILPKNWRLLAAVA